MDINGKSAIKMTIIIIIIIIIIRSSSSKKKKKTFFEVNSIPIYSHRT